MQGERLDFADMQYLCPTHSGCIGRLVIIHYIICLRNPLILLQGHRVLRYTLFISSRRYWLSSLWSFIHR